MFERSWKRALSWLRKCDRDRICNVVLIVIAYALVALVSGLAVILWRIV